MADDLESFAEFLENQETEAVAFVRQCVGSVLGHTFGLLEAATPVRTGALKEDLSMYGEGSGLITKDSRAAMEDWRPGQEVGIISALPYSEAIYIGGSSPKFAGAAQLDVIVEDGLNLGLQGLQAVADA
jgi:hypothetical protein